MKLLYSIYFINKFQVFYRVLLTGERKLSVLFNNYFKKKLSRNISINTKDFSQFQGSAQFFKQKQNNLAYHKKGEDEYTLVFLNKKRTFSIPFDWHSPELNKGTRLWKLNLHYMQYLHGVSNEDFVKIISDWIKQNPPYSKEYWLDSWNSYAISIRVTTWIQEYIRREENLSGEFKKIFLNILYKQLRFLYNNIEYDIKGNHIIKNAKALLWGGQFFSGPEATRWYKKGEKILYDEIDEQILPDGMHFERSPSYHCQVFFDLIECYLGIISKNLRNYVKDILEKMAIVLDATLHPDGTISIFNDKSSEVSTDGNDYLKIWSEITGNKLNSTPQGILLKDSGYYIFKDNIIYFIIKGGKIGPDTLPAHSHADIFSYELSLAGAQFVIDTGVFEYNPGEMRDYVRSTRAHNTVCVDKTDQAECWGSFRVARRYPPVNVSYETNNIRAHFQGVFNGYSRFIGDGIKHTRTVEIDKNEQSIFIKDKITGQGNHLAENMIHLHPEVDIKKTDEESFILSRDNVNCQFEFDSKHINVEDSWYCPEFGKKIPNKAIVLHNNGETLPISFKYKITLQ